MVSVILVNYDTRELLFRCLESIRTHTTGTGFEILVVDNGSENRLETDSLAPYGLDIRLIRLPRNTGFGVANNIGMKFATGKHFLLLNSDTYFVDDSLQTMVDFIAYSNPDILAPRVLRPDGIQETNAFGHLTSPLSCALRGNELYRAWRRLCGRTVSAPAQQREDPGWFSGACLVVSRKVFEQTGGFDPDFFLYCEELEWFQNRIVPLGFRLQLKEEFKVVHLGKGSDRKDLASRQEQLSKYLFWYKRSPTAFWGYLFLNLLNLITACFFWPVQKLRRSERFGDYHKAEWKALRRALWEIPRYGRHFAARPYPLALAEMGQLRWDQLATQSAREL